MSNKPHWRILVVDDESAIRDLLLHLLKREGHLVQGCENGKQALELLGVIPELPQIIILDLNMPVLDGWQFRVAQAKDPRLAAIPVIVITSAQTAEADIQSAKAAAFIVKPIQTNTLLKTLKTHVRKD